jgi:ArsR family transcriptional regulator, arsenate/arsenite/antimonite-responsive transcriptional repressor
MKSSRAIATLAALGQRHRFIIFRILVRAGRKGMAAGKIAHATRLAPNALSFHLGRLRAVGLVDVHRDGHSMIYTARPEAIHTLAGFLADIGFKREERPSRC